MIDYCLKIERKLPGKIFNEDTYLELIRYQRNSLSNCLFVITFLERKNRRSVYEATTEQIKNEK